MKVLPKEIHEKILEKLPDFMYSTNPGDTQLTWVQFDFDDMTLGITLDCDENRHSLKFAVLSDLRSR